MTHKGEDKQLLNKLYSSLDDEYDLEFKKYIGEVKDLTIKDVKNITDINLKQIITYRIYSILKRMTLNENEITILIDADKEGELLSKLCDIINTADELQIEHYIKTFINIRSITGGEYNGQ